MNGKNMLDLMGNIKPDFILEAEDAVAAHKAAAAEQAKAGGAGAGTVLKETAEGAVATKTDAAAATKAEAKTTPAPTTKAKVAPVRAVKPRGDLKWKLVVGLVASAFAIAGGILTYVYFGKNQEEPVENKATVIAHASEVMVEESEIVTVDATEEETEVMTTDVKLTVPEALYGISISGEDGRVYFPANADEKIRSKYGISNRDKTEITEEDLGGLIGTVTRSSAPDKDLIGKKVYHYTLYPDSNEIVIVETDNRFVFYFSEG
ncbi:MAG: hypothetical protein IKG93_09785 [Clostridiales bacterium]|nr:hypothetical protein [Clostridiales bacterium]